MDWMINGFKSLGKGWKSREWKNLSKIWLKSAWGNLPRLVTSVHDKNGCSWNKEYDNHLWRKAPINMGRVDLQLLPGTSTKANSSWCGGMSGTKDQSQGWFWPRVRSMIMGRGISLMQPRKPVLQVTGRPGLLLPAADVHSKWLCWAQLVISACRKMF